MILTLAIFKTSNDHQIWLSLAIFGSLAKFSGSSTKQTLAIFGYWNFHLHAGLFCKKTSVPLHELANRHQTWHYGTGK
jgi:hypothetical protein